MNMMTLQRYKNELIILITFIFLILALMYKFSATTEVQNNRAKIQQEISEISTITALKGQWSGKQLANQVKVLQTVVPSSKVASFRKKSKKLVASYQNLTGKELSKLTNKLINIPVQITTLKINQSARNQYTMECTCRW